MKTQQREFRYVKGVGFEVSTKDPSENLTLELMKTITSWVEQQDNNGLVLLSITFDMYDDAERYPGAERLRRYLFGDIEYTATAMIVIEDVIAG